MKRVAVVLAGCGQLDGAEIHESVLTLLSLDQNGADIQLFAPDKNQMHVINHLTGETEGESRNILVEAGRIGRGNVQKLSDLIIEHFDAVIFPGGYGAAKNLCDFALKGADCAVDPEVERLIAEGLQLKKVMGFICIAPVILAKVSGKQGLKIRLTIGTDPDTVRAVESMGALHVPCSVDGIVVDDEHRIVTTPAYMLGERISEVASGIGKLVEKVLSLC